MSMALRFVGWMLPKAPKQMEQMHRASSWYPVPTNDVNRTLFSGNLRRKMRSDAPRTARRGAVPLRKHEPGRSHLNTSPDMSFQPLSSFSGTPRSMMSAWYLVRSFLRCRRLCPILPPFT